jgi:C-terminal processing protease CtpA/Prc
MIVETIVPGSPASEVLQVGDEFKSVRGIDVTPENINSGELSFRGAPGEEVAAVIERGEDTIFVRVKRGKIESTVSKSDMIDWMSSGDGSDWGAESYTFNEVITDGDVAYAWTTVTNKDEVSGQLVESHVVTRFVFNEAGKVVAIGGMREDRFELEQQGYSVTR